MTTYGDLIGSGVDLVASGDLGPVTSTKLDAVRWIVDNRYLVGGILVGVVLLALYGGVRAFGVE
jgi:hypothetical protein